MSETDTSAPATPPATPPEASEGRSGLSIVIPALDEAGAISDVVADCLRVGQRLDREVEVLVVDDGSTDGTGDLAERAGATVLRHPKPGGYGHALKTGIRAARLPLVATLDADGTYPVERLEDLTETAERFDMVVGARQGPNLHRSGLPRPVRALFVWLVGFVTGTRVPDPNSGLRVFRREVALPVLDRLPRAFSFSTTLTLVLILEGRFVHHEPIEYRARIGRSKVRVFRDALRVGQTLVEVILGHNPLKLFLLVAFAPLFLGLLLVLTAGRAGLLEAVILLATSLVIFALGMLSVVLRDRGRGR